MKKLISVLHGDTAFDGTFMLLYLLIIANYLFSSVLTANGLVSSNNFLSVLPTEEPYCFAVTCFLPLILLLLMRVRLCLSPIKHKRLFRIPLQLLLFYYAAVGALRVFRMAYSVGLFL